MLERVKTFYIDKKDDLMDFLCDDSQKFFFSWIISKIVTHAYIIPLVSLVFCVIAAIVVPEVELFSITILLFYILVTLIIAVLLVIVFIILLIFEGIAKQLVSIAMFQNVYENSSSGIDGFICMFFSKSSVYSALKEMKEKQESGEDIYSGRD